MLGVSNLFVFKFKFKLVLKLKLVLFMLRVLLLLMVFVFGVCLYFLIVKRCCNIFSLLIRIICWKCNEEFFFIFVFI